MELTRNPTFQLNFRVKGEAAKSAQSIARICAYYQTEMGSSRVSSVSGISLFRWKAVMEFWRSPPLFCCFISGWEYRHRDERQQNRNNDDFTRCTRRHIWNEFLQFSSSWYLNGVSSRLFVSQKVSSETIENDSEVNRKWQRGKLSFGVTKFEKLLQIYLFFDFCKSLMSFLNVENLEV